MPFSDGTTYVIHASFNQSLRHESFGLGFGARMSQSCPGLQVVWHGEVVRV